MLLQHVHLGDHCCCWEELPVVPHEVFDIHI
jgi:hypothetical protein